ncbi:hypothetical protein WR25_27150 isoform B [Diploscapter pachys]|nr:hypothetical protein WR25_27150 isoform B [Diploscapter pachys]
MMGNEAEMKYNTLSAKVSCSSGQFYHVGYCYSFLNQQLPWNEAADYCQKNGAQLAYTENDDDATFYAGYIPGVFQGQNSQVPYSLGVWTAIRGANNQTRPAWLLYPGSYVVTKFFWDQNEPNIYMNYGDVCVSLEAASHYMRWSTADCNQPKYVVCKQKVNPDPSNYVTQCLCFPNTGGTFCEQQMQAQTQIACGSQPFQFACQSGTTIKVEYASFGAVGGQRCNPSLANAVQTCSNVYSLQTLINSCQGLPYCLIPKLSDTFTDTPCPADEELFLQYRIACTQEPQASCSSGAFYYAGRCYRIEYEKNAKNQKRFPEAVDFCRKSGGTLLSNVNSDLLGELMPQIRKQTKDKTDFWVDMQFTPSGPQWSDGTPVQNMQKRKTMTFFRLPSSNLAENPLTPCIVLSFSGNSMSYNSVSCTSDANSICQSVPLSPSDAAHPRPSQSPPLQKEEKQTVFKGAALPDIPSSLRSSNKFCKEGTVKGIKFPKTMVCTEATVPCPDPDRIMGVVTRYCNCLTQKWDPPNTNNCTHRWISDVGISITQEHPAEQISAQIDYYLGDTIARDLYGGDITGSVQLNQDVLNLAKRQYSSLTDRNDRQNRANNFTQSLGSAGDHLLSERAVPVWKQLDDSIRFSKASQLMSTLEQSTLLLAQYTLQNKEAFNYNNWAMEVDVRQPASASNGPMRTAAFAQNDAPTGYRIAPMSAPAVNADATPSMQFSSVKDSPIISLPSFDVLQSSSGTSTQQQQQQQQQQQFVSSSARGGAQAFQPLDSPMSGSPETLASPSLDRSRLHLGYYVFTTFGQLLQSSDHVIVNSHVIGAAVDDATKSLQLPQQQPATFTFFHLVKDGVSNPRCVFWDTTNNVWSTNGCNLISTGPDSTQCACTHLTSFAILMDVAGNVGRYSGSLASALDVVSVVGCALSIVCLALSLFIFTFFRSLYSIRNSIHANLCFCLLVAELTFVIGMDRTSNPTGCAVVALFLHYFFLASFCWMLLEGYQLYLMLIQVFEPSRTRILLYYMFCYGFPAVVVAISAASNWQNYGTDKYCWIDTTTPTIWAFIAPILIVIIANIVFLLIALKVVLSVQSRDRSKFDRIIGWLKGSATLLCLLGITWLFGFLTAVKGGTGTVFAWIFTILNCTQGIFIFVLHVVMNEKVRVALLRWLRKGVCCWSADSSVGDNSR